jgi:hypothetical protein
MKLRKKALMLWIERPKGCFDQSQTSFRDRWEMSL